MVVTVVGTKPESMCQVVLLYTLTIVCSLVIILVQMVLDTLWAGRKTLVHRMAGGSPATFLFVGRLYLMNERQNSQLFYR